MHLRIRTEASPDFPAIYDLVAAAFEHKAEANLVNAIRESSNYIPELSLVAEIDGHVRGHVMISWVTLRSAGTELPVPLLAPLAVAPPHQRQGIGGELTRRACAAADAMQLPMVLLEGDPGYYGRFGFEPASEHGIELPLPDWAPREAGQILTLAAYDPGLVGTVAYPAYFAEAEAEREG